MIEIYLAVLLFGLGSMYNQKKNQKQININKPKMNSQNNESNPYRANNLNNISSLENKYASELDTKCKQILPRDFSSLLTSQKSRDLYSNRKKGEYEVNEEVDDKILHYVSPKNNNIKSSLTGQDIAMENFISSSTIGKNEYNNTDSNIWAIPYVKEKNKQNMSMDSYQTKLDIHTGRSQFNFHKKEVKTFFKPSKDITFIDGKPSHTSTIKDRYIKSKYRNTELPFEQIKVGPGLGHNYGVDGSGGFHQFEINDFVKPKDIDSLRSLTNQQKTHSFPTVTGHALADKSAKLPTPPTTTKITTKKPVLNTKSTHNKASRTDLIYSETQKEQHREFETGPSFGSTQVKPKYTNSIASESTKNNINKPLNKGGLYSNGQWVINTNENFKSKVEPDFDITNYGKDSIKLAPNERDTTQNKMIITNIVEAVKAIISPLQDKMKRTKKQNIEGNPNPNGYMAPNIPNKLTSYDPNDVAKTTIKETTEINNHSGSIDAGPIKLTVYDPNDIARTTIKETTETNNHTGSIDAGPIKLTVYDPNDIAKTTIKETTEINNHTGSIDAGPLKLTVYNPNDIARTTIRETTENSSMSTQIKGATKLTTYDPNDVAKTTLKETLIHNTREGNIDVERNKKQMDYNFASAKRTMKETTIYNKHNSNVSFNRGDGKGYLSANFYAPSTLKQFTSNNAYSGSISSSIIRRGGHLSTKMYAPSTLKQFTSDKYYSGSMNSSNTGKSLYGAAYNALLNESKDSINNKLITRKNSKQGDKRSSNDIGDFSSKKTKPKNYDNYQQLGYSSKLISSKHSIGDVNNKSQLSETRNNERIASYNISALKKNPLAIKLV